MRAMVLKAPNTPLVLEDRAKPEVSDGATLLKVTGSGVCHSDIHVVDGDFGRTPIILGHEVVGVDDQLGPVMVYAPWGCRQPDCRECNAGLEMICGESHEMGVIEDGGYAEYVAVPHREYLVPLGDDLDPLQVAPLACGGLTAYRAARRAIPHLADKGSKALVIGAGGLGQYAIQFLKQTTDASVTVVDTVPARIEVARSLGADHGGTADDISGERFDAILDFVGAPATLDVGAATVARRGIVIIVGMNGGVASFGFGKYPSESAVTTSVWGSLDDLHELIGFARSHSLQYVVETMPLEDANAAHALVRSGESKGRIVLTV